MSDRLTAYTLKDIRPLLQRREVIAGGLSEMAWKKREVHGTLLRQGDELNRDRSQGEARPCVT